MTLPEGITAATVTVGVAMTVAGTPVKTHITLEASAPLIHVATGTPLVEVLEDVTLAAGASGSFTLPHTDQAGFEDGAGNAYTDWYYTARITYGERIKGKTQPSRVKIFQIPTGQDVVDLDLLPSGAAAEPWSAPAAAVSSFEGRTGPVTLLETDLPDRLSETELSATYDRAFEPATSIVYDGAGNVTSATEGGITTTFTYNANGTVNTETRLGKVRTWAYDTNGNPTSSTVV